MTDLINKYNRPTPRYTSYPPANHFTTDFASERYLHAVEQSNEGAVRNLSFYIHIPFCPRLCHYCACNAYAMQGPDAVERYMLALLREIDLVTKRLDKTRPITQIHYGGGTPTAIPPHWLARINQTLLSRFPLAEGAEIAIECHPGYLDLDGWSALVEAGFNRVSLGVQDFHPEVLKAVNREASKERFEDIFALLRKAGLQINLDLIYGLPKQSPELFAESIKQAIALGPDRLVTFAYAHVPWVKKQQLILERIGLPSSSERSDMFSIAQKLLTEAGYQAIGMDHFVLPDDPLQQAKLSGMLHRNFQGYCTKATTGQVYAFGVTAISQLTGAFAQNTKSIAGYIQSIEEGKIPTERGYALELKEQIAAMAISSMMCNGEVRWQEIAKIYDLDSKEIRENLYLNEALLRELEADKLIDWGEEGISLREAGKSFVRIVASALDPLMSNEYEGNRPYSMAL